LQSLQLFKNLKKVIYIASIICVSFLNLNAANFSFGDDKNKRGDDKKSKVKRDDTTKIVMIQEPLMEEESDDVIDTAEITFPSHDLYATWDTNTAHPYKFNETFKEDSVMILLTQGEDNCFVMPYKGHLTSLFGWRKYRPHYGTDIDLEKGDTIVSAFDGMVRVAKYYQGYGNCVIVRHKNGLETVYGHMSKLLVESGQKVEAGSTLGLGGNTGRSRGSHLHFEIRYLGQALDSQDFIDFEKGELKDNVFVLRKCDVENKYDLRALHNRHKMDVMAKNGGKMPASGYYKVRKGDTLGAIARRKHTTVKALCKKNKIKPTTTLRLGQRLKI
jgi:murein DD-endopeptidase MepM/ murein hydrolase activator NlpD